MMIRNFFLFFLFFAISSSVYCQESDFGLWYGADAEYSLNKKIDFNLSAKIRTYKNGSELDQAYMEFGTSCNFNKYLSVAGSYRLINKREEKSEYHFRHDLFADIKGSYPLKNFSFSLRLRFQTEVRTYYENEEDKIPKYVGRVKLKCVYNIPKFPVNPYASIETFSPLFESSDVYFVKSRYTLGLEFKLNKKNSIETEYILQAIYYPDLVNVHIISLNYNFKF